jgi:hypothetical protein
MAAASSWMVASPAGQSAATAIPSMNAMSGKKPCSRPGTPKGPRAISAPTACASSWRRIGCGAGASLVWIWRSQGLVKLVSAAPMSRRFSSGDR